MESVYGEFMIHSCVAADRLPIHYLRHSKNGRRSCLMAIVIHLDSAAGESVAHHNLCAVSNSSSSPLGHLVLEAMTVC